ncbi:MAG: hypothetical protein DRJ40_07345 [Thermoprotei archaeon]|nr:MAG: hypothetical protein DRJ40_07345 [Thermoprotei archaeon]
MKPKPLFAILTVLTLVLIVAVVNAGEYTLYDVLQYAHEVHVFGKTYNTASYGTTTYSGTWNLTDVVSGRKVTFGYRQYLQDPDSSDTIVIVFQKNTAIEVGTGSGKCVYGKPVVITYDTETGRRTMYYIDGGELKKVGEFTGGTYVYWNGTKLCQALRFKDWLDFHKFFNNTCMLILPDITTYDYRIIDGSSELLKDKCGGNGFHTLIIFGGEYLNKSIIVEVAGAYGIKNITLTTELNTVYTIDPKHLKLAVFTGNLTETLSRASQSTEESTQESTTNTTNETSTPTTAPETKVYKVTIHVYDVDTNEEITSAMVKAGWFTKTGSPVTFEFKWKEPQWLPISASATGYKSFSTTIWVDTNMTLWVGLVKETSNSTEQYSKLLRLGVSIAGVGSTPYWAQENKTFTEWANEVEQLLSSSQAPEVKYETTWYGLKIVAVKVPSGRPAYGVATIVAVKKGFLGTLTWEEELGTVQIVNGTGYFHVDYETIKNKLQLKEWGGEYFYGFKIVWKVGDLDPEVEVVPVKNTWTPVYIQVNEQTGTYSATTLPQTALTNVGTSLTQMLITLLPLFIIFALIGAITGRRRR